MTFFSPLICALGRCRPSRESVRWDIDAYTHVGACRDCSKPIRRVAHCKWEKIG